MSNDMVDAMSPIQKSASRKRPKIVGNFIREKREQLGLSQRSLGQLFTPPVTTQFISNVERGVTPLPPSHVPTLAQALSIPEEEIMEVLEREYAEKLSGKLGKEGNGVATMVIEVNDHEVMTQIYQAYRKANPHQRENFVSQCRNLLKIEG